MSDIINNQYIALLLMKQQNGNIDTKEERELNLWITQSDENKKIYETIVTKDFSEDIEKYKAIDTLSALKKYKKRQSRSKRKLFIKSGIAAAVVILIFATSSVYKTLDENDEKVVNTAIVAGTTKAELILSDGKVVDLSKKTNHQLAVSDDVTIDNDGRQISYTKLGDETSNLKDEEQYNELRTPIGGEYMIVLEDGTKVWLNSSSRLSYPVSFSKNNRNVRLEGEAYFQVAKDHKRPFYVTMKNDITVQVLGTSFNIRVYNDEDVVQTALEEGAVRVNWLNDSLTLQPNHLSTFNHITHKMQVQAVDAEEYSAWSQGQFVFNQEPIESILNKLSKWYDIQVIYKNEELKTISFSGNFKRYDDIAHILNAIEMAGGIKFDIKGKKLIVTN